MKRVVVFALVTTLVLILTCPVYALSDQPKFDRENYIYATAEWIIGDPYGEDPYTVIEFEIGRYKSNLDDFVLQLHTTDFDGTVYTMLFYNVIIPNAEFTFPRKLDSGLILKLQTQGTQYGYSYELDDEYNQFNEQQWEEPVNYDFDLVWTRDNHVNQFVNNHFALSWGGETAELIDVVYKSKDDLVNGSAGGTINQLELSDGAGSYGISIKKIPIVYDLSSESSVIKTQALTKNDSIYRYNDVNDFSNLSGFWFMPFGDDPDIGTTIYLSIGMHDKRTKTWALNINEDILNEDNEVIGWRSFVAEIPDSAFAFPKESPGTIVLDIRVIGTMYDYYIGEDGESEPEPIITEFVEHDIKSTWNLLITQTSKAISKFSDDYSRSIDIQKQTYFDGIANLEFDGVVYDEASAWGSIWINHSIGK